jgi:hypothetical protein
LWRGILGRKFNNVERVMSVLLGKQKVVSSGISANWKFYEGWIGHSEATNCCVSLMQTENC